MCLVPMLLIAGPALAQDPTAAIDLFAGVEGSSGTRVGPWTGGGFQAAFPLAAQPLLQVGGRVQFAAGLSTMFVSVGPVIALKASVDSRLSLFVDLSADLSVELVNPGLAPHARVSAGGFYGMQGYFVFAEVYAPRVWRRTMWTGGVGYAIDFL